MASRVVSVLHRLTDHVSRMKHAIWRCLKLTALYQPDQYSGQLLWFEGNDGVRVRNGGM
jgi:hypothetical protein